MLKRRVEVCRRRDAPRVALCLLDGYHSSRSYGRCENVVVHAIVTEACAAGARPSTLRRHGGFIR